MPSRFYSFSLAVPMMASMIISGCTTTYDPAEVCTAEWIKPRAERAISDIESETRSAFKTLKKSGKSFSNGKTPGPFQLIAISSAVSKLTNELKNGRGIKDLRILRNTCNDPDIISDALTDLMRDQGLPDNMIGFIQNLDLYQDILTEGATATPNG